LLVNQPEWIQEKCEEQIAHHLKQKRAGYLKVDQDIINVLFRHKIKYLDIKYNLNVGFYIYGINESFKIYGLKPEYFCTYDEVASACENPVINHCMGDMSGRPWEEDNIHPQNNLYDRYLAISPWKNTKKAKVQRAMIFKAQRLLYQTLPSGLYAHFHKQVLKQYLKNLNRTVIKK
jgi:lipopolysaccharide biosynthesis glycosyltransferase